MRGEVTYFDDIVKELSEEFDIDIKEMREICSLSLDYIRHLMKQKATMAILLPYLGVMYFNASLGKFFKTLFSKSKYNDNELVKSEIENLEYRLEKVKKSDSKRHKKRPLLYKFKRILKRKEIPLPKVGVTLGQNEMWNTVSQMQNEINDE